jgi:hypothetical protein
MNSLGIDEIGYYSGLMLVVVRIGYNLGLDDIAILYVH